MTVPTEGAFATGRYRNLFAERGQPESEVEAKIAAAYASLFHGDPESEAVVLPGPTSEYGPTAYVMDVAHEDVRSEGMSYGMMIAVQLGQKRDFDAIWTWAKLHLYHADPHHPAQGFFSWRAKPDGRTIDEMPAPDGETYFATALLFAAHRWGTGGGIFDYEMEARTLLSRMRHRAPISGVVNDGRKTTGVTLFNPEHKMVRFTPDTDDFTTNGDHTDPSYHLPAFYELWALWGPPADRAFWAEAAQVSRDFLVAAAHPQTGLCPDYANFDGTPLAASWDAGTVHFRWDAWRVAMNWGMDTHWFAKDPRQTALSNRLLGFFDGLGPEYPGTYTLAGEPLDDAPAVGLIATNAVAALAATDPRAGAFVDRLYATPIPTGKDRYYDGVLYLLSLLHLSGNFRIW